MSTTPDPSMPVISHKCRHPRLPRCFYIGDPPTKNRLDTGEPDEYFGGEVEPLIRQRDAEAALAALREELSQAQERIAFHVAMTREAQEHAARYGDEALSLRAQIVSVIVAEREACARVCETHPLTLEHQCHSMETLHDMAVAEAGCRGAFADAIRARAHLAASKGADHG